MSKPVSSRAAAKVLGAAVALGLVGVPFAARADWPLGSLLDQSVIVDITSSGFGLIESLAGAFVPSRIDIPPFAADDCSPIPIFGGCFYEYDISVSGLFAEVAFDRLDILPGNAGQPNTALLNLDAAAVISVNSPSEPAILDLYAAGIGIPISDTCQLWVDPINLEILGNITMQLVPQPDGTNQLDVVVPPIAWSWDATGDDIQFGNCGLASVINTVNAITGIFGFDLYDTLLGLVEPEIDSLVNSLPAELEPLIEDAFASLTLNQEIDLLGAPLTLQLYPGSLTSTTDGMRVTMASSMSVPTAECVAKYGITESAATPSPAPALGDAGASPFAPDIVALIDDDFVNHLLFAVWSGGVLCYDISSESSDLSLPLPIDTGLLGLMAPGVFDPLFPDTEPMAIRTDPRKPPYVEPVGDHDVNVVADELGLGFFVDLDGRQTRLMNIDLKADIGIDVDFDGKTGNLGLLVDAGAGAITPTVTYNEFMPDASAQIEGQFSTLFDLLVGPLLGGALDGLAFPLPAFEGVGLTGVAIAPAGTNQDFVGAYAAAGIVPYYSAGCDKKGGGCDTSGCSSGCTTGGVPGQALVILFPLIAVALRRRR